MMVPAMKKGVFAMLGIITLWVSVALQAGYTVYCMVTQSRQTGAKKLLRFSALGLVSALLCLKVFDWDFRWIPLFAVLAFLSAVSLGSTMLRVKEKPFRAGRAVLSGVLGAVLLSVSILPAIVFPQFRQPAVTGAYGVLTGNASYVDENRVETYTNTGEHREVNVTFWYPDAKQGKFPLVVFSHGFCGVRTSNQSTFRELASHGYVVCSVDHPYQSLFTVNESGRRTFIDRGYIGEYTALGGDLAENIKTFRKWMDIRVADLSFVIDSVIAGKGGVYALVDPAKIGVFGHSLGGAAATGVPRVRRDIGAVVNLDAPMMCELTGVEDGHFTVNPAPYPVPILQIYSQYLYDNGIEGNDPEYEENRLVAATAPASYEVVFKGSQHMNLTDLPLFSPLLANLLNAGRKADIDQYDCIETMNRIILEFFDCTLKGSGSFQSAGTY
jgi:dienelactone hydrolase